MKNKYCTPHQDFTVNSSCKYVNMLFLFFFKSKLAEGVNFVGVLTPDISLLLLSFLLKKIMDKNTVFIHPTYRDWSKISKQ